MIVNVETNAPQVAGIMGRLFRDQMPFVLKSAINSTTLDAQKRQRAHQRRVFQVRNPRFVDRAVKIKPFASKSRPTATIRIDPPGGTTRGDILTKFETEREKLPRRGKRLAVPVDVRRTKTGAISGARKGAIRSLELQPTSKNVAIGKKRTFAIRKPGGRGGVYQRVGRGKRSRVRTLFLFAPRVQIRPELNFVANVTRTVHERFEGHYFTAFDRAVRTAR